MIIHKPKQHGNANKPSTETLRKARDRGPDGTMPAESRYLRSEAWQPAPGQHPIPITKLAEGTCKWPLGVDRVEGFCGHTTEEDERGRKRSYCPRHHRRSVDRRIEPK